MATQIRANRLEISDRFPLLSFTVNSSSGPRVAEIVLVTDIELFTDKGKRNSSNFFSSRELGLLSLPAGPAVYTVPPQVLSRFANADRLWFGLATADAATGSNWDVDLVPRESSPYISMAGLTDKAMGRVRMFPSRSRTVSRPGAQPAAARMEWAGDAAHPGTTPAGYPNDENRGSATATPATNGGAAPANGAAPASDAPYDDGFGPLPPADQASAPANGASGPSSAQSLGGQIDPENMGIDGPAYTADAQQYSGALALTHADYDRVARATPSPAFTAGRSGQTIDRIVIHITDAPTTQSTVNHFTRADANSSSHYLVGQDGEIVQFVSEADTAWHARGVNSRSIGIEHVAIKEGGVTYGSTHFDYLPPTDIQYSESSALVVHLCDKYGLNPDRTTIIGHREAGNTTHSSCPDGAWNWDHFMDLVTNRYSRPQPTTQGVNSSDWSINWDEVQKIGQPTGNSCWATAAAMLIGWRDRVSISPQSVAEKDRLPIDHGLSAADKRSFADAIGLVVEPNASFTADGFRALLEAKGPIWVTARVPGVHAIVVTGMYSENGQVYVRITDPWSRIAGTPGAPGSYASDPGNGSQYILTHEDFAAEFEAAGNVDRIQLLHTDGTHGHTINRGSGTGAGYAQGMGVHSGKYVVVAGDSLSKIAARQGVSLDQLLQANPQITNPDLINVGDEITITAAASAPAAAPAASDAIETILPASGTGFTTYNREAGGVDQVGKAAFVRALIDLAAGWAAISETPISFGDMSRQGGSAFPPHAGHRHGNEVDIRPLRSDRQNLPTDINDSSYDRAATRRLIEYLRAQHPSASILFNDPEFIAAGLTTHVAGHDNHIHLRLNTLPAAAQALGGTGNRVSRAMTNQSRSINWDEVQLIAQPTDMACWSTTAAMLIGWRDRVSVTPDYIAQVCGKQVSEGLNPGDQDNFATMHGLTSLYNQSYLPEAFSDMIESYGPIFVIAGDQSTGIHAILVTGMYNDGEQYYVRVTDPWDRVVGQPGAPGGHRSTHISGSRYIMTWEDFQRYYERTAGYNFMQIMHSGGTHGHTPNRGQQTPLGYAQAAARGLSGSRALFNESFTLNWDEVDMIGQPTNLSCWATAGALVVGWGRQQSVTPQSIAELAGRSVDIGLNPADVGLFKDAVGLVAEPPQNYTQEAFRDLLEEKGPLWVGAAVPSLHVVVVTGLYNEGEQLYVRISDPWDRTIGRPGAPGGYLPTHTTGSRYIMKWEDFVAEYEKAAADYASVNLQILHNNGVNGRTPNRGERTPVGYAQAVGDAQPMPARGEIMPDNPFGGSTVLSRQRIEKNGRSYDLAQLHGMVQPSSPIMNGNGAAVPGERVLLDDWPYIDGPTGKTQAGVAIDWAHSAGKVGDIAITPLDGQTLDGWSVAVKADLLPNGSSADVARIKVRITTTFNKEGEEAQIAISDVTLGGDGRNQIRHGADQAPLDVPPEVTVRQDSGAQMPSQAGDGNGSGAARPVLELA